MSSTTTIESNKTSVQNLIAEVINTGRLDLCDRYLAAARVDHMDYGMPAGMADADTKVFGACSARSGTRFRTCG